MTYYSKQSTRLPASDRTKPLHPLPIDRFDDPTEKLFESSDPASLQRRRTSMPGVVGWPPGHTSTPIEIRSRETRTPTELRCQNNNMTVESRKLKAASSRSGDDQIDIFPSRHIRTLLEARTSPAVSAGLSPVQCCSAVEELYSTSLYRKGYVGFVQRLYYTTGLCTLRYCMYGRPVSGGPANPNQKLTRVAYPLNL